MVAHQGGPGLDKRVSLLMHCFLHHENLGKKINKIRRPKQWVWHQSWLSHHPSSCPLLSIEYERMTCLREGEALFSRVSWGRKGGKEGSIKRPEAGALGTWQVGGSQLRADGLQSTAEWKGDRMDGQSSSHCLLGLRTSQNMMRLIKKAEPVWHSWCGVSDFLLAHSTFSWTS